MANTKNGLSEMECVEKLRDRLDSVLSDKMKEDTAMFVRFLRARNYDLDAAEIMLRKHIAWRDLYRVNDITSWYKPAEVTKYIAMSFVGFDKEGHGIVHFHFGNIDMRGFAKSTTVEEIRNYFINTYETNIKLLEEHSKKIGKEIVKMVYIVDFENFSLRSALFKPCVEIAQEIISLYDANYPERLKTAICFNTSFVFQVSFAFIKPLMASATLEKLKIFGKTGWQEELLKIIDPDVLPAFLGGNRTDPNGDPLCKTFIKHGGTVPEHLYLTHQKKNFANQSGVKKITINRLSEKLIELKVTQADSVLEWEFETKEKDIYFCVLYKEFSDSLDEVIEVIPKQKIDASIDSEYGVYKCEKPGTYILEFDNSYSWIHQKEIYYKVQIIPSKNKNNTSKCKNRANSHTNSVSELR